MSAPANITPNARYKHLLEEGSLSQDEGQAVVIDTLDRLYQTIISQRLESAPTSFWQRLRHGSGKVVPIKGLYLYGGVGRGKSRLMDLFYECLPKGIAIRVHFHDFMVAAHDVMNDARKAGVADPIAEGAKALLRGQAKDMQSQPFILCFDEMEVRDIADAMIVKRLFDALFAQNIIIVATSNRHPDALYENGLHRDRFLPFIAQLQDQCEVLEIAQGNDWRRRLLGQNPRWYVSDDAKIPQAMTSQFELVTGAAEICAVTVKVAGRDIIFDKVAENIAFIDFASLCAVPLAARDYVAIADRLTGLFITKIPRLGNEQQNEARRFMWLIDALYDRGRFIVASADVPMASLYDGEVWAFEFERTMSRLQEMTRH